MDDRTDRSNRDVEGGQLPDPPGAIGSDGGSPPPPGRSRRRGLAVLGGVAAAVLLIAGVGLGAVIYALRGSGERLTTATPADVDFFATAYLDPSAQQKLNLERMLRRFPALGSSERIEGRLDAALDGVLADAGLTAGDVRSWLGSQVAIAGRLGDARASFGVLMDSDDDAAARATLAELRSRDVQGRPYSWSSVQRDGATIWVGRPQIGGTSLALAVADGTVVLANSLQLATGVTSAASGAVPSLEDSSDFQRAIASLPEDRLALGYADIGSMMARLGSALPSGAGLPGTGGGLPGAPGAGAVDGVAVSVGAHPEGLRLDVATTLDPTRLPPHLRSALAGSGRAGTSNETLSWVPSDAYGVVTMSGLREQIEAGLSSSGVADALPLEQLGVTGPDGVVAHLTGDASIGVIPGADSYPTGALVLGTDDADGMRAFLDRISDELVGVLATRPARAPTWSSTAYRGVEIRSLVSPGGDRSPLRPSYAVVDGAGILAASPEAVRAAVDAHEGTSIASEPSFRAAVAAIDGFDAQVLYVDVDRIGEAVREALPPEERSAFDLAVAPNLEPIDAFVAGARTTATGSRARMMLLIR